MARILIAEDDPAVRAVLRRALEGAGHTIEEAADGQQALDRYRHHPADLVLADLYMPQMDGLEMILRLKAERPDARIVAISGGGYRHKHDVLAMARQAGARGVIAKPFELSDLLSAVSEALAAEPTGPGAGAATTTGTATSGGEPSPRARVLLVDDDPLTRSVLRKRLEAAGHAVIEEQDVTAALERLRTRPVDLVLVDLILPGRSGTELIEAVRSEHAAPGVVAISGDPQRLAALQREIAGRPGIIALPKPFTTVQLLEALDAVRSPGQPAGRGATGLWAKLRSRFGRRRRV